MFCLVLTFCNGRWARYRNTKGLLMCVLSGTGTIVPEGKFWAWKAVLIVLSRWSDCSEGKVACAAREAAATCCHMKVLLTCFKKCGFVAPFSLQAVSSEYCYNCLQSTIPQLHLSQSDAKFSDALNFPRVFLVFIMHLRAVQYSWLLSFLSGCISGEARCSMCGEKTDWQFTLATLFCNF